MLSIKLYKHNQDLKAHNFSCPSIPAIAVAQKALVFASITLLIKLTLISD